MRDKETDDRSNEGHFTRISSFGLSFYTLIGPYPRRMEA